MQTIAKKIKGNTMDTYEYGKLIQSLNIKMNNIENIINPSKINSELCSLKLKLQDPTF